MRLQRADVAHARLKWANGLTKLSPTLLLANSHCCGELRMARRVQLAEARKAAGYTQEALAEALGVDRSTVIRWEAGDHDPLPYIRLNCMPVGHLT